MTAAWIAIIAQVSPQEFGRAFRGATSQLAWTDFIPYVAAIAALIGGMAAYSHLKRRADMTERCDDPGKLFRELCLAHQLDASSRRLLWTLATAARFPQPGMVFLTPGAFEPARLPAALRGRADEVRRLREKLF